MLSQVYHRVSLTLPFRDIMVVEKPQENNVRISDLETHSALVISMKDQVKRAQAWEKDESNIDFRVGRSSSQSSRNGNLSWISCPIFCRNTAKPPFLCTIFQTSVSDSHHCLEMIYRALLALAAPLYLQFNQSTDDQRQALENVRHAAWQTHFAIYGRGSTMYRTNELYEMLLQGIPDAFRNELWLIFSGAFYEVRMALRPPVSSHTLFFWLIESRQSSCLSENVFMTHRRWKRTMTRSTKKSNAISIAPCQIKKPTKTNQASSALRRLCSEPMPLTMSMLVSGSLLEGSREFCSFSQVIVKQWTSSVVCCCSTWMRRMLSGHWQRSANGSYRIITTRKLWEHW